MSPRFRPGESKAQQVSSTFHTRSSVTENFCIVHASLCCTFSVRCPRWSAFIFSTKKRFGKKIITNNFGEKKLRQQKKKTVPQAPCTNFLKSATIFHTNKNTKRAEKCTSNLEFHTPHTARAHAPEITKKGTLKLLHALQGELGNKI